jgi:hypothetical protein
MMSAAGSLVWPVMEMVNVGLPDINLVWFGSILNLHWSKSAKIGHLKGNRRSWHSSCVTSSYFGNIWRSAGLEMSTCVN